jgi:intracellular sulfur oxidation DsrE/DsrF family protein
MSGGDGGGWWARVQNCDPRILYLLFALLLAVLQFKTISIPAPVPRAVQSLHDLIEKLPGDRIVVIDSSADVGWLAEAGPTLEVVVRHLFRRKIPFAICSNITHVQGQRIGADITDRIAREMNKEYGKDYCYWQAVDLLAGGGAVLQALARDIPGTVREDINGVPLSEVPMMRSVRDIRDVALVYRVAYMWDVIPWIGFVQAVYGTPFAVGLASITSSTAYPYLDAGQLSGVVAGAAGAAAYERLLEVRGGGTKIAAIQSFATLYVILAIVLGNIAMFASRAARRRRAGAS